MSTTELDDYILTEMPDGTISIWHEGLPEAYIYDRTLHVCTCPGFRFRRSCRHALVIKFGYIWNLGLSDPRKLPEILKCKKNR